MDQLTIQQTQKPTILSVNPGLPKSFAIVGLLLTVLSPLYGVQKSLAQEVIRRETTIYYQGTTPVREETQIYRYNPSAQIDQSTAIQNPAVVNPPYITAFTTADNVTDDPQDFAGRIIAVRGEVDEVLGPNSFRLKNGELPVFSAAQLPVGLTNDDKVMIVGELRPITAAEAQQNPGLFGLAPAPYINYGQNYAMVAREVMIMGNDD